MPFFLFLIVLLSYGQILGMGVWQDDNGLFFKLAHLSENAGYLSAGPFGSGPYKYIHTAYIPIYSLFRFNTHAYFFLSIVFYCLATYVVYRIYKNILGREGGKIAGFLYAAGYIASDGFIRLFNTIVTSISVMTVSFLLLSYNSFFKTKKVRWYLSAVFFYFLSVEAARGRTHYLIGVILAFEIIFFDLKKMTVRKLIFPIARLIPFIYVFYLYFIKNGDHRSANVGSFVRSLLRGDFYQLYGFLSSTLNLFIPDWFVSRLTKLFSPGSLQFLFFGLAVFFSFKLFKNRGKKIIFIAIPILLTWYFLSSTLFLVPQINPSEIQRVVPFAGSIAIWFLIGGFFLVKKQYKRIYLVLSVLILGNIAAYSAYNPLVVYESANRYLAHSLFALVGILGIIFVSSKKGFLIKSLVILWGAGNIFASIFYQNNIVKERSVPTNNFYSDLKTYVQKVEKDDIFYFDVADDSRSYFADAFSVASMPETTAIAWRYGVDRYDLYRVTEFDELRTLLQEKKLDPNKVYSFFYSKKKLYNTTNQLRQRLLGNDKSQTVDFNLEKNDTDLIITPKKALSSVTPNKFYIDLKGNIDDISRISFPYISDVKLSKNQIAKNNDLRNLAFEYAFFKKNIFRNANITTSSNWRVNIGKNLNDGNQNTLWQADRVIWGKKEPAIVTVDMGQETEIDRVVWTNAYANNSPTHYKIESSLNGKQWKELKDIQTTNRIESWQWQTISFTETKARFIRLVFIKTLNGDSPGISEIWTIPSEFRALNIESAEEFISKPFGFLPNKESYIDSLKILNFTDEVKVSIKNDKRAGWIPLDKVKLSVVYDSKINRYSITLPAGGTQISQIALSKSIPGSLDVQSLLVTPLTINDLQSE